MTVRIHLSPEQLREVTSDPAAAEALGLVRLELFEEWGILVPPMRFALDAALAPGAIRFSSAGLADRTVRGPGPGELSVFWWTGSAAELAAPDDLREATRSVVRRPGAPCAVLPDRFRSQVEDVGYTPYRPLAHLVVELSDLVGSWAAHLQTAEATGELVARLAREAPTLVSHVERLPAGTVHRLLVGLLRDRVPIRQLPRILELALRFDALDEPAPDRLTFVRWGLADVIGSVASRQSDVVVAYLLSREHEDAPGPALLHDLDAELRLLPPSAPTPALLTSDEARAAVAEVLREARPEVLVLGYGDVPPDLNVQPVARVGG